MEGWTSSWVAAGSNGLSPPGPSSQLKTPWDRQMGIIGIKLLSIGLIYGHTVNIHIYIYIHICMCIHTYIYIDTYLYVYTYIYRYIFVCVYTYIYIYEHKFQYVTATIFAMFSMPRPGLNSAMHRLALTDSSGACGDSRGARWASGPSGHWS